MWCRQMLLPGTPDPLMSSAHFTVPSSTTAANSSTSDLPTLGARGVSSAPGAEPQPLTEELPTRTRAPTPLHPKPGQLPPTPHAHAAHHSRGVLQHDLRRGAPAGDERGARSTEGGARLLASEVRTGPDLRPGERG